MSKQLKPTNIKNGKIVPIMHGECWFQPIDEELKGEAKTVKSYIAGHSETGHNHVLESPVDFKVYEGDDNYDLRVLFDAPAQVTHKKSFDIHETQVLAPGKYAVYHKTEFDPFQSLVRAVWD